MDAFHHSHLYVHFHHYGLGCAHAGADGNGSGLHGVRRRDDRAARDGLCGREDCDGHRAGYDSHPDPDRHADADADGGQDGH